MQRRAFLASTTAAVAGIGGCLEARRYVDERAGDEGGEEPAEGTVTTAIPSDRLIEIRNGVFEPRVAEVHVGGLVRWANHDDADHEVTSARFHDAAAAWEFSSGVLGKTDIVSTRFDEKGVYEYYCSIHGREEHCGAVLVGDVELPGSLPCE